MTASKYSPTIRQSQESTLDYINARRRRIAAMVRALLDEVNAPFGEHMATRVREEKTALQVAYAALAKPRRDQRA